MLQRFLRWLVLWYKLPVIYDYILQTTNTIKLNYVTVIIFDNNILRLCVMCLWMMGDLQVRADGDTEY